MLQAHRRCRSKRRCSVWPPTLCLLHSAVQWHYTLEQAIIAAVNRGSWLQQRRCQLSNRIRPAPRYGAPAQ